MHLKKYGPSVIKGCAGKYQKEQNVITARNLAKTDNESKASSYHRRGRKNGRAGTNEAVEQGLQAFTPRDTLQT